MAKIDKVAMFFGTTSARRCPWCRALLMRNRIGSEWCSNDSCGYHTRHGRPIDMAKTIARVNAGIGRAAEQERGEYAY